MDNYVCLFCGNVYDPEEGDPYNDIELGTLFDDLPDDWTRPVYGSKHFFGPTKRLTRPGLGCVQCLQFNQTIE